MVMASISHLHELNATTKIIDHFLVPLDGPPFNREVILAAGADDPKRDVFSGQLPERRRSRPFGFGQVNVTAELRWLEPQIEPAVQKIQKVKDVVAGPPAALRYEHRVTAQRLHGGIQSVQRCDIRIVRPELGENCPHIRYELAGVMPVQIPQGGRQHHHVPEGQVGLENEFARFEFYHFAHGQGLDIWGSSAQLGALVPARALQFCYVQSGLGLTKALAKPADLLQKRLSLLGYP